MPPGISLDTPFCTPAGLDIFQLYFCPSRRSSVGPNHNAADCSGDEWPRKAEVDPGKFLPFGEREDFGCGLILSLRIERFLVRQVLVWGIVEVDAKNVLTW